MRLLSATALFAGAGLGALGLAGCGSAAGPPPGPVVTLALSTPQDLSRVSGSRVRVGGRVSPRRVRVEVLGRSVAVTAGGSFSTTVGLAVGTNLIDVIASAPRSAGAVSYVRVIRFLLVTMPDVVGEKPAQASATLKRLGLHVQSVGSEDPFNSLLPGSNSVCSSTPSAGSRIDPGSLVVIKTSKLCF